MKKRVFALITLVMLLSMSLTACAATPTTNNVVDETLIFLQINNPNMYSNGVEKQIDEGRGTSPIVDNGRTLVPIRSIIEECGGTVSWNGDTQTVTLNYKNNEIKLIINSTIAYLNGEANTLDVAPKIINGRTLLPIRFIAESFKFEVFWDGDNSVITITNNPDNSNAKIPVEWLSSTSSSSEIENMPPASIVNGDLEVHFIDVGQGDAIFLELPNEKTMLIDAGPSSGIVPNYIKEQGYSKLNYVVTTHPDSDHINGMPEVLNTFEIETFYMPEKEHTTQIFDRMLDALADNGCDAVYAIAGKEIINSEDLKIYFVGPTKIYGDNNACSAVVKLEYKEVSMLFTGDAEYSSESDMLRAGYDLSADILKVGHHGSSSSTSSTFLKAVNPKEAIISVCKINRYGHTTDEVIAILNNADGNIYRTDEVGTIVITSDGKNYTIDKNKSSVQINAPPVTTNNENVLAPETDTQQETQVQNNNATVYRTKTGAKYHSSGCSYLKSSIPTTVSEAKSMGLTPCSRCNPPQ